MHQQKKPQTADKLFQKQFNRYNSMRPRTANVGIGRSTDKSIHRSYGKFQIEDFNCKDSQKISVIWEAFGRYVARNIKQGKGVAVPKFGQFSFTSINVDLNGATNANVRDVQERFPVFLIGKDFNCHLQIQQGIASGMTTEMYGPDGQHANQTNHLRIYGNQGQSGIIPKVKLNYFEVAAFTDGEVTKDECKQVIDQKIRNYSEQVRRGQNINEQIPHLGRFQIKNGIAGVIFNRNIFEEARCQTVRRYNSIFGQNNWMNDRLYEANKTNFGQNAKPVDVNSSFGLNVTRNASNWLKNNLGIEDYEQVQSPKYKVQEKNDIPANSYSEILQQGRKQRAYSAVTRSDQSSAKTISRYSQASTFMSRVPELAPFELMNLANEINLKRSVVVNLLQNSKQSINMREVLTTTQIQKVLAQAACHVSVSKMKALLKELGFEWNGKSCSMLQLMQQVKEYINPPRQYTQNYDNQTNKCNKIQKLISPEQEVIIDIKKREGDFSIIEIIKDLFYSSGMTMYQLFKLGTPTSTINLHQFSQLVQSYAFNMLAEQDIELVFEKIAQGQKKDKMMYKDFEQHFSHSVPIVGSMQSETLTIKKVREWMFQKQYQTKTAFERLLRSVERFGQLSMRRVDFHKAIILNRIGLNAPEIDFLFDILTEGQEVNINLDHWSSKIYDDVVNPLQLIRECVHSQNINEDDLLYQMKIKIWDDPMPYKKFEVCLHRIDPSFSDSQCKTLFQKLKNQFGLVEIPVMINNICGTQQDTVDYKNNMFKQLYEDIYKKGKQDELLIQFENSDTYNDGRVAPKDLQRILSNITNQKYTYDDIQKFIRQVKKDENYKIGYLEFMDKITSLANKDHNPFRSLMHRLTFFLEQNKISVANLLSRLSLDSSAISINKFTDFLKQKIDKRRDFTELFQYSQFIDIDKDGFINEEDLKTCLRNINSITFFKDSGQALRSSTFNSQNKFFIELKQNSMHEDKILQVCQQIREGLLEQKMSILALWNKIDIQKAGLINLSQFGKGSSFIVKLAAPILEKIFSLMDTNGIGMVDYDKFSQILSIEIPSSIPKSENQLTDGFQWQEMTIKKIREWVINNKLGPVEAFRSFDRDLNGVITKESMKKSLIEFISIDKSEINNNRMDRLFKMLSFYKQNTIQQSDFDRLLCDNNPYYTSGTAYSQTKFQSSMGGGLTNTSTTDWKFAALQQIGLVISQKYASVEDSFKDLAGENKKIHFQQFLKFVNDNQALNGFNITHQLMQRIFAELDPHKKAFLSMQDWCNGFKLFNKKETMMIEFKNFVQSNFININSTYAFLQQHGPLDQTLNFSTFQKAIVSIFGSKRAPQYDIQHIFKQIAGDKDHITKEDLKSEFQNLDFIGTQYIRLKQSKSEKTLKKSTIKTVRTSNTSTSKWEADVLDKLKLLIKQSGKPLDKIFKNFDTNQNGLISRQEFIQTIQQLCISISEADINKIMNRVDANKDGWISYSEFAAKLRDDPQFEIRMKQRANNKLGHMKQQMTQHMTSIDKAFQMFDSTNSQTLSFLDFDQLLKELSKLAGEETPCYLIVRDLFDAIDSKQDQIIDVSEWAVAFNTLESSDPKLAFKTTPIALWQNTFEAKQIKQCMHRNRKLLIQSFNKYSTHSDHNGESKYITFEQARKAVEPLIILNFNGMISNAKLDCLLSVAQVAQKISKYPEIKLYDFMQLVAQN